MGIAKEYLQHTSQDTVQALTVVSSALISDIIVGQFESLEN